jgi:glucosamine--fructose-6-phosphate aminotransferase (isomerizing)
MTERGKHTFHEIMSQPQVWQDALAAFRAKESELAALFANNTFDNVIVTGCGSTYYLALTAARLLQKFTHLPARAYPASEIVLYPDAVLPNENTLLIAVSRSGTTSETVRALNVFREKGRGKVLTVTCNSRTPLAQGADMFIAIEAAQEISVAQTRSFSSMCVVLQQIAALVGKENLAASESMSSICQTLFDVHSPLAQSLGENPQIQKFFFLGADALYGIAAEAMLKMKEMSLSYSEVFHTLEFRHGPMSMVGADSLVVGLVTASSAAYELQVLKEMQAKGATILAIAQAPTEFEHTIVLPDTLPSWTVPILYLPVLQLVAYHRALFNQQDPDNPHNLTQVISLDNI